MSACLKKILRLFVSCGDVVRFDFRFCWMALFFLQDFSVFL